MPSFAIAGALNAMSTAAAAVSTAVPGLERCLILLPGTSLLSGTPVGDLNGTLQHAKGALTGETVAVGRAVVVPGLQCTLFDVATVMLSALKAIDVAVDINPLVLTCALLRYNEELLMPGRTPGPNQPLQGGVFPAWRVGLQVTLPLEFDAATQRWRANLVQLKAWGAEYESWGTLAASKWAEPLETPQDALAYRDAIAAQVPTTGALAPLAASLRARLLTNACEVALDLVHLLRAVRERRAADLGGFVLDLATPLKPHHAKVLAGVSGGHAVLRALWRELAAVNPGALSAPDRTRLATVRRLVAEDGLGLRRKSGATDDWDDPDSVGPRVQPAEPPLSPGLRWSEKILGWEKKNGKLEAKVDRWLNGSVLGRLVRVSKQVSNKDPWGYTHSFSGSDDFHPVAYLKTQGSTVPGLIGGLTLGGAATLEPGPLDEPRMMARMLLAGRIAASEGMLDAVSAGDPGIISMGMQQWAAHNDNELTVLLERFRVQAPDLFDLYIGMWGLQTARWYPEQKKEPVDEVARGRLIDFVNPFGPDPVTLTTEVQRVGYFPQHVSFFVVDPQTVPSVLPPPPFKQPGPRRSYFLDAGRADAWCARFRLAELLSPELCRVQLHQAAWRFSRVASEEFSHPNTGRTRFAALKFKFVYPAKAAKDLRNDEVNLCFEGAAPSGSLSIEHAISDLLPSELAAAAALDVHINSPSNFIPHLRKALRTVRGPTHRKVGTGGATWELDADWLRRLAINYVGSRGVVNANAYRTQDLLELYEVRKADACAEADTDRALTLEVPPPGPPPAGRFPW